MRERQEKAMDRAVELDQLRANRARQKEERANREREIKEAEEALLRNIELNKMRDLQIMEKQRNLIEQAAMEK